MEQVQNLLRVAGRAAGVAHEDLSPLEERLGQRSHALGGLVMGLGRLQENFQGLITEIIDDDVFQTHPASIKKHHIWFGGLMDHTTEVVRITHRLMEAAMVERKGPVPEGEMQVAMIAALLHDFCKTSDYSVTYNVAGLAEDLAGITRWDNFCQIISLRLTADHDPHAKQIGHIQGGALLWRDMARTFEVERWCNVPDIVDRVTHCLLSHHQLKEWGSPVSPRSMAAWAVHLADMTSVNMVEQSYLVRGENRK